MKKMESAEIATTIVPMDIRQLIYEIRGLQVILDRDLAMLYGVPTKALNQAVKRNAERFPDRFMFRLSESEMDELVTSCDRFEQLKHSSVTMCAFTEQGIAMLSSVLRSAIAVRVSVWIMDAFVAMRKALATMAPMQSRLEAIERRQIVDQSRNEERFDQIFAKMSEGDLPLAQIFYQGKFWDAKSLLIKFIRRAKKELIVIDAYPGVATLDMLAKRGRGVKVELVTHSNGELAESDFEAFAKQCGKFTKTICGICHDRFIIADQKEIYWSGASLKDAGRLTFAAAKLGAEMIPGLLASIRKATSATNNYKKGRRREMTTLAYHGTDRMDFGRFDIAETRPYNIGLHFGTKAAAESRIAFLQEKDPSAKFRRLFQKLGYDGFVYRNEIKSAAESADSYVVFDGRQMTIVGEESVGARVPRDRDCRAA